MWNLNRYLLCNNFIGLDTFVCGSDREMFPGIINIEFHNKLISTLRKKKNPLLKSILNYFKSI